MKLRARSVTSVMVRGSVGEADLWSADIAGFPATFLALVSRPRASPATDFRRHLRSRSELWRRLCICVRKIVDAICA